MFDYFTTCVDFNRPIIRRAIDRTYQRSCFHLIEITFRFRKIFWRIDIKMKLKITCNKFHQYPYTFYPFLTIKVNTCFSVLNKIQVFSNSSVFFACFSEKRTLLFFFFLLLFLDNLAKFRELRNFRLFLAILLRKMV